MARRRYDHRWKEVRVINGYAMLLAYVIFAIRGIAFLVVTWTTVVLLGGFVSMIDSKDFWRLMLITLVQILWVNISFFERAASSMDLLSSSKTVKNVLTRKWQLADKARRGHLKMAVVKRIFAAVRLVVGLLLALVHSVLLLLCILSAMCLFFFGLPITTSLSIYGLVKRDYYGEDGDKRNMYPAHYVLYALCVAQGAAYIYLLVLYRWQKRIVNQVSQAYGFQDGGRAIMDYCDEIATGCERKPSSAEERNLITYAIELMDSKSPSSFLSGTLILERLLTRKYPDHIIAPTLTEQGEKQHQRQLQKRLHLEEKAVAQLIENKEVNEERRNSMEERRKKREERRHKRQQREETIIAQQRRVIKRQLGSASSTHILKKLLDTLDSKHSHDKKMREAAAKLLEYVASGIRLEEFPRAINCISSLINSFEEYRRLQPDESSSSSPPSNTDEATTSTVPPSSNTNENNDDDEEQGSYSSSESEPEPEPTSEYSVSEPESESYNGINRPSSSKPINGYKDLVLTGLSILWSLAGSEDNCIIIRNTKHLVPKIIAPISYDLVHRTRHSAWSASVVDASMRVMLRLMATAKDTKGDTGADLHEQISNSEAQVAMVQIVTCQECKGGDLQMTAMQILMQLRTSSFNKKLVDFFIKGDHTDVRIRKTAGKELVLLFLSSTSVDALLLKEENVRGLTEIVSQGDDAECRQSAAEILEHMCIHYTKNGEYFTTLKNAMTGVIPKVLREILHCSGLTGEEEEPGYLRPGTDIESQVTTDGRTNNKNNNLKLYVSLLSLYVTACEKLPLDIDGVSSGRGDEGEGVAFRFAMRMVQSNKDRISADSLTVIKLSTRMVIATLRKLCGSTCRVVGPANLESLMESLTSISNTMLDLEGSMVFSAGRTTTVAAAADTLDSLVTQAGKLHSDIQNQESGINFS